MKHGRTGFAIAACLAAVMALPVLHYGLGYAGWYRLASLLTASAGIGQAAIYIFLLVAFASSLLPGHMPVVTRIARFVRGDLSPELTLYTRRVTIAWCGFFACDLACSLLLLLLAPHAWVYFVTALNLPLLALMAVAEYSYRLVRYRHIRHESPADMVRLMKQFRGFLRSP